MSPLLLKIKNKSKKVKNMVIDQFLPYIRTREYSGFKLYYSKGTSLIDRIEQDGSYEENVCKSIAEAIKNSKNKIFVDVGANIGLISLRLVNEIPELEIYAFEPGPHQYELFRKTIYSNELGEKIKLNSLALSNKKGKAKFATHSSEHVSGDGFYDTGRAGQAKHIEVKTDTLDNWWKRAGNPKVGVMKIDTEGAELMVLQGADVMLKSIRPVLFLEIWPPNLGSYPYNASDIFEHLVSLGYALQTHDGQKINKGNCLDFFAVEADYIAYPNTST